MPIDRIEFARRVKDKYPQYQGIDDLELANAVLNKYPQYRSTVSVASFGEGPDERAMGALESFLPEFAKVGVNESITGLATQLSTGKPVFDLKDADLNLLEHIGATVVSFLMPYDAAIVIAGGGIGGAAAKKAGSLALKKLIQAGANKALAKQAVKKAVIQVAKGGGALGAYNTTASAVGQLAKTGEVDVGEVAKSAAKGTMLGALAAGVGGAVALAGGKAAPQFLSEAITFGTAAPLMEGEPPSLESYATALGVVGGLRTINIGTGAVKRGLFGKSPQPVTQPEIETVRGEITELSKPQQEIEFKTPEPRPDIKPSPTYEETTAAFEKQRSDLSDKNKWTPKRVSDVMRRAIWDVGGGAKEKLLKAGGPEGEAAVMNLNRVGGASAKAEMVFRGEERKIYSEIRTVQEENLLNDYIQALRTIEIDRVINPRRAERGEAPVKHPTGLASDKVLPWIAESQRLHPEIWPKIERAAQSYFEANQGQLREMLDAGLINKESFESLSEMQFYSPRRFIQHMDPDVTITREGKTVSVPDSGIRKLKEGSEQSLVNNSRLLLSQSVARTQNRIFRNDANKSLYEFARENPDNGFVEIVPPKLAGKGAPGGKTKINVVIDGVKQEMLASNDFAHDWLIRDPEISMALANTTRIASGSFILRPFATGAFNPAFAVTNLPRDIALSWMTTSEYSKALPVAAGQYARDFATIAKDAFLRKGRYTDYINEGGGMEFMTHQGRIMSRGPQRVLGSLNPKFRALREFMEYMGNTSEILTRLALRERAIRNGRSPQEATIIARSYLDFSQGGSFIKAIDNAIPYLNAATQATRSIVTAAKNNPALFGQKVAQVMGLSVGLYLANKQWNPEAYDEVPDRQKVSNWIITTPFSWTDENGQKRWLYISIPKDQGQRVFATTAEALLERQMEGKMPAKQMFQAIEDFLPIIPTNLIPPSLEAIMGYVQNQDFWMKEDIWKGPEVDPREEFTATTPAPFVQVGEATGLSPERLQFALGEIFTRRNIYTDLVGAAWKSSATQLSAEDEKTFVDQLRKTPFARRLFKATSPTAKLRGEIDRISVDENTRRYIQNRTLRGFTDQKEARKWIRTQPQIDRQRLFTRLNRRKGRENVPYWWFDLAELPPEARATAFFAVWSKATPAEQPILLRQARRIPGVWSGRFGRTFNRLKRGVEAIS